MRKEIKDGSKKDASEISAPAWEGLRGKNLIGAGIVTRQNKLEDTYLVAVKSGKLNIDLIREVYREAKKH
jgi:hypothetical protein